MPGSSGTTPVQVNNTDNIDLLATHFQRRYEAGFAWANALSALSLLPGLRGLWPMSSVDETGAARDMSGQARTLAYNGNPVFGSMGLAPYIKLDGTGDYLSRADEAGFDILGNEATILSTLRGLTVFGWFRPTAYTYYGGLITKWNDNAVNQRSYLLRSGIATGGFTFLVSTDGIASVTVSSTGTMPANAWYFAAGRFTPSTELRVYKNDSFNTNAVAVPATLFNSTASFIIGNYLSTAARTFTGYSSLCGICAAALPHATILSLYHITRPLFGV